MFSSCFERIYILWFSAVLKGVLMCSRFSRVFVVLLGFVVLESRFAFS